MVGANGFEPSTSWSRTSGQNHISRCPGVTNWFSGRSVMDKSGHVIAECCREFWGINLKLLDLLTILWLIAERIKNLSVLSGVAYNRIGFYSRLRNACLSCLFELADVGGLLQIIMVKRGSHSFPVRLPDSQLAGVFVPTRDHLPHLDDNRPRALGG
jgi:hypothetical protein